MTTPRARLLWLLAPAALLLGACAYFDGETTPYRPPAFSENQATSEGETLYMRDCAWCHGERGEGTENGPDIITGTNGPAMTHFMLTTGRMPIDFAEERVEREEAVYNDAQIDAIVEYVDTFHPPGPDIPEPDVEEGDMALGAELYQENCAACHSSTGIGSAITTGRAKEESEGVTERASVVAPSLAESTATEIAEAMLVGPGTMPVFGPETLTREEVDAIVRYALYLKQPDESGGAPLGLIGPFAEGAVGWILGLGAVLVLLRWVGTKVGEEE